MEHNELYASGRLRFTVQENGAVLQAVNVSRDLIVLPPQIITENGDTLPLAEIGQETFYQTMSHCIVLPDSVQRIAPRAFSKSPALQAVCIPASVRIIDRSSFLFSDNVMLYVERGSYAERFARVMKMKFVYGMPQVTPEMNRNIVSGDWVYRLSAEGKAILREYTGDASVLSIPGQVDGHEVVRLDPWCFDSLSFLQEVVVPDGVTSLGQECFGRCTWLEAVTLPQSVQWLEEGAFANCKRLRTLVISEAIRRIPALCFAGCHTLSDLPLPAALHSISFCAFYACTSLREVELPQGMKSIDTGAFGNCVTLRRITLNEGLDYVSDDAFDGCEQLYMPDLPASLPKHSRKAFRYCIGAEGLDSPEE